MYCVIVKNLNGDVTLVVWAELEGLRRIQLDIIWRCCYEALSSITSCMSLLKEAVRSANNRGSPFPYNTRATLF